MADFSFSRFVLVFIFTFGTRNKEQHGILNPILKRIFPIVKVKIIVVPRIDSKSGFRSVEIFGICLAFHGLSFFNKFPILAQFFRFWRNTSSFMEYPNQKVRKNLSLLVIGKNMGVCVCVCEYVAKNNNPPGGLY